MRRRLLFREVNTRIRAVERALVSSSPVSHLLCECGRADCLERVDVAASVYDELCDAVGRFLAAPGHERGDSERVVVRETGYAVVITESA